MAEIFVSIACYRDMDVINTVESLIKNARTSLRIIVLAQDLQDRWASYKILQSSQVEVICKDLLWSEGPCKARAEIMKYYQGEKYIFQADSHMRFVHNWDNKLISELNTLPPKSYLTTLPPNFDRVSGILDTPSVNTLIHYNTYERIPLHKGLSIPEANYQIPASAPLSPFLAAGVLFGHGRMWQECPLDPYLYFLTEEFALSMRLWTHGYKGYSPRFCFCFHAYRELQKSRVLTIQTTERDRGFLVRGLDRIHVLLGMKSRDQVNINNLIDFDKYNLGNILSIKDWENTFNIYLG